MRINNLIGTGIILALGTERLYVKPTHQPTIMRQYRFVHRCH